MLAMAIEKENSCVLERLYQLLVKVSLSRIIRHGVRVRVLEPLLRRDRLDPSELEVSLSMLVRHGSVLAMAKETSC